MGPSGVNWKERFTLLKKTFISSPDKYRADLLSWFDGQIFTKAGGSSSSTSCSKKAHTQGEVDELIQRLFQADVTHSSGTPASSSGAVLAPAQVEEPLTQTRAMVQAKEPVEADDEPEEPPWGRTKKTRSSKKAAGK